ncbi:MAG: hypothetical protein ABFS45_13040 [Pseudomonadota bacterium]
MTKTSLISTAILFIMTLVIVPTQFAFAQVLPCENPVLADLVAGQHTDSGDVSVCNEADTLYVQYATVDGWLMTETHLVVEQHPESIPQMGSGNPKIGHFTYQRTYTPGTNEDTYEIDLSGLGLVEGDEIVIAAHAVVQLADEEGNLIQQETAWGDGEDFAGRNWATYITYTLQSGTPNGGGDGGDGGGR